MVLAKINAPPLPQEDVERLVALLKQEILNRFQDSFRLPRALILFGSAASGKMTSYSDLDIVVVVNAIDDIRPTIKILNGVSTCIGWPVDLLVVDWDQFVLKRERGGVFCDAWNYGKILFEEIGS